jgi:hypothetical protein
MTVFVGQLPFRGPLGPFGTTKEPDLRGKLRDLPQVRPQGLIH